MEPEPGQPSTAIPNSPNPYAIVACGDRWSCEQKIAFIIDIEQLHEIIGILTLMTLFIVK